MQRRTTGLTWHEAGDDLVVLDLEEAVYLRLNASGRVLWDRLSKPSSTADLEQALVDEFGIAVSQAGDDVADFIAQLTTRRLLEA